MWGDAAPAFLFSKLQRGSELVEGVASEHGADKRAVGLEDVVDLGESAREVVDPVHAKGAHDKVEALRLVRESLLIFDDVTRNLEFVVEGLVRVAKEQLLGGIGSDEIGTPSASW